MKGFIEPLSSSTRAKSTGVAQGGLGEGGGGDGDGDGDGGEGGGNGGSGGGGGGEVGGGGDGPRFMQMHFSLEEHEPELPSP